MIRPITSGPLPAAAWVMIDTCRDGYPPHSRPRRRQTRRESPPSRVPIRTDIGDASQRDSLFVIRSRRMGRVFSWARPPDSIRCRPAYNRQFYFVLSLSRIFMGDPDHGPGRPRAAPAQAERPSSLPCRRAVGRHGQGRRAPEYLPASRIESDRGVGAYAQRSAARAQSAGRGADDLRTRPAQGRHRGIRRAETEREADRVPVRSDRRRIADRMHGAAGGRFRASGYRATVACHIRGSGFMS